jgi:hypothetical protein
MYSEYAIAPRRERLGTRASDDDNYYDVLVYDLYALEFSSIAPSTI